MTVAAMILLSSNVAPNESGERGTTWEISGVWTTAHGSSGPEPALYGELTVKGDHWMVEVSGLAQLGTRGEPRERLRSDLDADAVAKTYGPWASHLFWDYLALQARAASTGLFADFEVPRVTPEPQIVPWPSDRQPSRRTPKKRPTKPKS